MSGVEMRVPAQARAPTRRGLIPLLAVVSDAVAPPSGATAGRRHAR